MQVHAFHTEERANQKAAEMVNIMLSDAEMEQSATTENWPQKLEQVQDYVAPTADWQCSANIYETVIE